MENNFDLYSKEVMKHFKNPKNMGVIKNADGIGTVGNPKCGDVMKVYLKISKQGEYIKDVKVQTLGCGAAIATSSMATELVKGKTIKEALKITNKNVTEKLGGLPKAKLHCSVLAEQGIKSAIEDYKKRRK